MSPSRNVQVELDVPATMRDGVVLRANVYRPAGEGRWPVLLSRLPYGKDFPLGSGVLDPVQAARRGYVVIVQDTRGRFASDGEWEPIRHEAADGVDTIAWAAGLPYSDGQVGMYGASYFGFTQWAAALERPPALRALVPVITWSEPLDGLVFRGGALELGLLAHWTQATALNEVFRRHRDDEKARQRAVAALAQDMDALASEGYRSQPLREFAPLRRHPGTAFFFEAFGAPMDRERSDFARVAGKQDGLAVPTLNVGGWYDAFLQGTLENYVAMRRAQAPAKLVIGPWSHRSQGERVGELSFGYASQAAFIDLREDFGSLQLRWFDHWLRGTDTGMLREPPVKLFVMGANLWRDEADWPLARAVSTPFYLRARGALSAEPPASEPPDRFRYDPADPVPTRGGALLMTPEYEAGPLDQRPIESRSDVVTYTTSPLGRDLEVTGPVSVRLFAASSAPDTDFVARLVDVHPDGYARNLTDGIVRARHRAHPGPPSLIEPGRAYEYRIDLWATSNLFRAGHCIRLHVASSSFPRWDRNPNTGAELGADDRLAVAEQTILHDRAHPSRVLLPVVPPG